MSFEIQILDAIQTIRTPFLDSVMMNITALGNSGIIWIILAFVLVCFRKTRKMGLMLGLALVFDLLLCNFVLKPLAARTRPFEVNTAVQLLIRKPKDYSFPSGHTAAAFACTTAFFMAGWKKMGAVVLFLSVLISFSRMYLYVHYPTDVLGGIIVGIICGTAGVRLFRMIDTLRQE